MNTPRIGSDANACTETMMPERTRNVPSRLSENANMRQQQSPAAKQAALLRDCQRMNQRRAHEPRHERGVLYRIPDPPAAPAELVVRPPAAERDAYREKEPRDDRPRPRPARPGLIESPFDHRRARECEGDREADVAGIENRRMDRERRNPAATDSDRCRRTARYQARRTDSRSTG